MLIFWGLKVFFKNEETIEEIGVCFSEIDALFLVSPLSIPLEKRSEKIAELHRTMSMNNYHAKNLQKLQSEKSLTTVKATKLNKAERLVLDQKQEIKSLDKAMTIGISVTQEEKVRTWFRSPSINKTLRQRREKDFIPETKKAAMKTILHFGFVLSDTIKKAADVLQNEIIDITSTTSHQVITIEQCIQKEGTQKEEEPKTQRPTTEYGCHARKYCIKHNPLWSDKIEDAKTYICSRRL